MYDFLFHLFGVLEFLNSNNYTFGGHFSEKSYPSTFTAIMINNLKPHKSSQFSHLNKVSKYRV